MKKRVKKLTTKKKIVDKKYLWFILFLALLFITIILYLFKAQTKSPSIIYGDIEEEAKVLGFSTCKKSCITNADCEKGLICRKQNNATRGNCFNPQCPFNENCLCTTPTPTPQVKPTPTPTPLLKTNPFLNFFGLRNCGQICSSSGCKACACNGSTGGRFLWRSLGRSIDCTSCWCGQPLPSPTPTKIPTPPFILKK